VLVAGNSHWAVPSTADGNRRDDDPSKEAHTSRKELPRLPAGGWSRYASGGVATIPDMDNPVTVSFQWPAEELLTAQRVHMRHSPQFRTFWRTRWTIVPLGILGGSRVLFIHGLRPDGVLGPLCAAAGTTSLAAPSFV